LNKTDLVSAVCDKTGLTKKDATAAVDAIGEAIVKALANGDKVQLIGFGSYEVVERAARMGMNPQTKEKMPIPARKAVRFRAGKALKDAVQ